MRPDVSIGLCDRIHFLTFSREPEFKKDFEETQQKCRDFAVAILNVCRNSREVEMVLDDLANIYGFSAKDGKKPKYRQGYIS